MTKDEAEKEAKESEDKWSEVARECLRFELTMQCSEHSENEECGWCADGGGKIYTKNGMEVISRIAQALREAVEPLEKMLETVAKYDFDEARRAGIKGLVSPSEARMDAMNRCNEMQDRIASLEKQCEASKFINKEAEAQLKTLTKEKDCYQTDMNTYYGRLKRYEDSMRKIYGHTQTHQGESLIILRIFREAKQALEGGDDE